MGFPSTPPRAFISYARKDGEEFARTLRQRLERDEPEITLWQDRAEMQGGVGWWNQITAALDQVEFLVIVMTPAALESEITRKEWRYAREQGVCICPVKGVQDSQLDYGCLPSWMRKAHFYDHDKEWETFVRYLKSPCLATRSPFMVPHLREGFVQRPEEFGQIKGLLLDRDRIEPIAIATALRGAGGFGKTTLATALCHDDEVITAFDDGILWVTLGQKPNIQGELTKLYAALTGERPGFIDVGDAATELAAKLEDKNCLVVIDDVWDPAHLKPFRRGGKGCARLVTTRQFDVAVEAARIDVRQMKPSEAVQMLIAPLKTRSADLDLLRSLAQRLGEWPLLLILAAGALRQRLERGDDPNGALAYLNRVLDKRGVTAFDRDNPSERDQAIASTLQVSLDLLSAEERKSCLDLAIFSEDTDVPLTAIGALWGTDEFDTEDRVQRLDNPSLLDFDLQRGSVHLHDSVRAYFAGQIGRAQQEILHAQLVAAWSDHYHLPDAYAWRWLAYHLVEAGRKDELRRLLLDFNWLQAKLEATDVNALIADFDYLPEDKDLQLVQGVLRLASHVLARDNTQLAGQLLGRLLGHPSPDIQTLLDQTREWRGTSWLRPLTSSLTPPGGPLLRTLRGYTDAVIAVAFTLDGQRAISTSWDKTLKVWDWKSGEEVRTLSGHGGAVRGVAVTPDGQHAISASWDKTLKVWDLESGEEVRTLSGHKDGITAVTMIPNRQNRQWAISASEDCTLKVWDLESGEEVRTLSGHSGIVKGVAVSQDGRFVISASWDKTLSVWDLESGEEVRMLKKHDGPVNAIAVDPNGQWAISASWDRTLKVWDLKSGEEVRTLRGHDGSVNAVAMIPNSQWAISASRDETLKVWDLESGREVRTLRGHDDWVNAVAVTSDGLDVISTSNDLIIVWNVRSWRKRLRITVSHTEGICAVAVSQDKWLAISASKDCTLKIWNLQSGKEIRTLKGHIGSVMGVAISKDGSWAVSGSSDRTLKIWDLVSGKEVCTLMGHIGSVRAVALTRDGRQVVSASNDRTVKVWELESRKAIASFAGEFTLTACAVAPDEVTIIAGEYSGRVHFLRLEGGG